MRTFAEFCSPDGRLDENFIVTALGHLYMSAVGALYGGVTGAVTGAAQKAWQGLTTGDPFNESDKQQFVAAMSKFQTILARLGPEDRQRVKQQLQDIIARM